MIRTTQVFVWANLALLVIADNAWSQALTITAVTTSSVNTGVTTSRNTVVDSASNNYTINYDGIELQVLTVTVGGQTYTRWGGGVVIARRNSATEDFSQTNANQTVAYNAVNSTSGTGGRTHSVSGRYLNTMELLYQSNNLRSGTENLFVNTDPTPGNTVSNVERMDYIFSSFITADDSRGFSVFERGGGGSGTNGGFRIAAITGFSGGLPTFDGSAIIAVADGAYSNGGAGIGISSYNYDVFRYANAGGPPQELDFINNVNIGPQHVAGAFFRTTQFVSAGTTVYGYAIFGEDETSLTAAQLADIANFNTLSPFTNDMDLVASGVGFYAVPEPSTIALLGLVGTGVVYRRWWRRQRDTLHSAAQA
jgi:hypothetical protein